MATERMIKTVQRNVESIKAEKDVEVCLKNFIVMDIPSKIIHDYKLVKIVRKVLKTGGHTEFARNALQKFENTKRMEEREPVKKEIEDEEELSIQEMRRRHEEFSVERHVKEGLRVRYEVPKRLPTSPSLPEIEFKNTRIMNACHRESDADVLVIKQYESAGNQKNKVQAAKSKAEEENAKKMGKEKAVKTRNILSILNKAVESHEAVENKKRSNARKSTPPNTTPKTAPFATAPTTSSRNQKTDDEVKLKESLKIRIKIPYFVKIEVNASSMNTAPIVQEPMISGAPIPSQTFIQTAPVVVHNKAQLSMKPRTTISTVVHSIVIPNNHEMKNIEARLKRDAEKKAVGAALVASNMDILKKHREERKREMQLENEGSSGVKKAKKMDYLPIF